MKIIVQKWRWLAGLLTVGLVCATYLLAQSPPPVAGPATTRPGADETSDSTRLIDAVNSGDTSSALSILRKYGVAGAMLQAMASRLGTPSSRVALQEPFLKASVAALAISDPAGKTNAWTFSSAASAFGYDRPVWVVRDLGIKAITRYDADLAQCPLPPIAVLNVKLDDPRLIRFFLWYDRYAESLHSVALNGENLNNIQLDPTNYAEGNRTLNTLFQLIKARKPDAFVWLSVVKEDNRADETWLKAMTFQPDGLQISNLRQFHSPFAKTRERYAVIVGSDTPMMVSGFYGQATALQQQGTMLSAAVTNTDPQARETIEAQAKAQLGGIGAEAGQALAQTETELESLGYRGLSAHWLLLAAVANSSQPATTNKSNLIDPTAGMLDIYYGEKDYRRVTALALGMISNSAPGDLSWTVGKLYEGIGLVRQIPRQTVQAAAVFDEILAFDYTNLPGRDHYILGAAKWRIYAASLLGDTTKGPELVRWVQNQPFRSDLKASFLKEYTNLLNQPAILPKQP